MSSPRISRRVMKNNIGRRIEHGAYKAHEIANFSHFRKYISDVPVLFAHVNVYSVERL